MAYSIKIVRLGKVRSDGSYSVALQIIHNRKKSTINTGITCLENEFKKGEFTKACRDYSRRNRLLHELKNRAVRIADEILLAKGEFSIEEFKRYWTGKNIRDDCLQRFSLEYASKLKKIGKTGHAKAIRDTINAINKYANKDLKFSEITPVWLEGFEMHERGKGNTTGGIAFKMRELRLLFNKAIQLEVVEPAYYPFGKYKISKLKSNTHKRALRAEEFKLLKALEIPKGSTVRLTYDMMLVSFYCRGMNFVDLMLLKKDNIQNGLLSYTRAKTGVHFKISLLPQVVEILEYYSRKSVTDYVFPILLKEDYEPTYFQNKRLKALKKYNRELKLLAKDAGIQKNVTSYVIRHSYATIMKNLGVSTDIISESMGHSNVQVTTAYLKEFGDDVLDKAHEKLKDL